jgi:uncharacterized protein (DUF2141 family)
LRRALAVAGALAALAGPTARAATLAVEVEGVTPGVGQVQVALCVGGLDAAACREGQSAPAAARGLRVVFPDVPRGTYAIAAFQDLDGSGRLERTPLGLPTKPYGFSNGAGRRGRPDFAAAAFALDEPGAVVRVRLQPGAQGRPAPTR